MNSNSSNVSGRKRVTVTLGVEEAYAEDVLASLPPAATVRSVGDGPQVDPRALYRWLGRQASRAWAEASDSENAVNLDASVGPGYMAEAFVQVRERMRKFDPSLPVESVDNDVM